jgi:putative transcriptional regulator
MSKSKVAEAIAGLAELCEAMEAGIPLSSKFTVRHVQLDVEPHSYTPEQVRQVREQLSMSQTLFARFLGVDANTIRSWEQGTRVPSAMARRFLDEIKASPEHWSRRLAAMTRVNGTGKAKRGS